MIPITTKAVIPGQYIERTVKLGGLDYKVLIYYAYHKAIPAGYDFQSQPEPAFVEITNVLLNINDDFIQLKTTKEWDEEWAEEIKGELEL